MSHLLHVPQPLLRPGRRVDMSLEKMRPIPHFSEKGDRRCDCRVCSSISRRRATTYFCFTCSDRPHLHPGKCFTLVLTLDQQIHSSCCLYWFTRCICSSQSPYLAVPSPLLHSHTFFLVYLQPMFCIQNISYTSICLDQYTSLHSKKVLFPFHKVSVPPLSEHRTHDRK